ncbi:hypothetical protein G9A89_019633 [Geosiphon pyriformis]|nr:hypothetical protein G9A89_019633 [Geosiphon pyriformis]
MSLPEPAGKWPYLGHLPLIWGKQLPKKFAEWGKEFSGIYMIWLGQQPWIILTSDTTIHDLLHIRGVKYSSRSYAYFTWELVGRKRSYLTSPYNDWYKKAMGPAHSILGQRQIASYVSLVDECTTQLLKLLKKDGNLSEGIFPRKYFHHTFLNVILNINFAFHTEGLHDPLYQTLFRLTEEWFKMAGATKIYDFLPILRYFSNRRNTKKKALLLRDEWETTVRGLYNRVKNDPNKTPCFARDFIKQTEEGTLDEFDIIHLAHDMLMAGTDTLASAMTWLAAILATHPEIQAKAHEELDRVVGKSRLPDLNDEPSLPYIRALIKENLRWAPPAPLGAPHFIEEEDQYMKYHIPKNSVVVMNIYSVHSDDKRYKHPHKFDPTRFLGNNESAASSAQGDPKKRDHFTFGAGRRLCIGVHLAEVELQLAVSRILWAFRIEPVEKVNLNDYDSSYTQWIKPYHVRFVPRHEEVDKVFEAI